MNYKLLMDVAVLAGEILLSSGAETYRVEDTMNHILRTARLKTTEAFVIATGFMLTLDDPEIEAMTVVKRIESRSTDLNKVYRVNDISRRLCGGVITLEEAYEELSGRIPKREYSDAVHNLCFIGTSAFFTMILGGNFYDILFAAVGGTILMAVMVLGDRIHMNSFCKTALGALSSGFCIMVMERMSGGFFNVNVVIIGTIMPIVPGVVFTTAIRDTLYGDYISGCSRIVEAVIVALGVAAGIGSGIALFQSIL